MMARLKSSAGRRPRRVVSLWQSQLPRLLVKTKSLSCRSRCWRSRVIRNRGSEMLLAEAVVLGGPIQRMLLYS
jgi:hypothetical protein